MIPETDAAGFAERLLAVIDEGRRTATYKLALLLALLECCMEAGPAPSGKALSVSTRTLTDIISRLYWQQLRPFSAESGVIELRQITNKSASILNALTPLRHRMSTTSSWEAAEKAFPKEASEALDKVELTVARYPILRLQVIDGLSRPFIYDIDWDEGVSLQTLHNLGTEAVRFRTGAADALVRLTPLIRPLVESHWVRMVAVLNAITPAEDELRRHLFGAERATFPIVLRRGLCAMQGSACFYCEKPVDADHTAVDHFIPWVRWPNDAIENLVVAHGPCNGHKSDRIPGPRPLRNWCNRIRQDGRELRRLAVETKWSSAAHRTVMVATSLYGNLPVGTPLWNSPGDVVNASTRELMEILETAEIGKEPN